MDSLVLSLQGIGTDSNLIRIDRLLRFAGADAPPQLEYFLRRYRSEQLYYQGLFDESMVEAEKAHRIAEQLQDSLLLASSLNQVAVLLEERGDNRQAIAMLRAALRWYPQAARCAYPITQPHRIHGNLGRCYANIGELDSARTSEERSFQLAAQANVPRGMALALLELGHLQLRTNNFDSALVFFDAAIDSADIHAIHDVQLDGLAAKAGALVHSSRIAEAVKTFDQARHLLRTHPAIAKRSVLAYHDHEVRLLADAGLFPEALSSARAWRTLDSALRSSSATTAQRILATIHTTDAELAREHIEVEQAAAEMQAQRRNRLTVQVGSIAAILLLITLIAIYIGRGRQKDKLERLALQRLDLDRQVADLRIRQQVGEDLHDDIGAGLSALKLHCELAEDLSGNDASRDRNRTLSRIAGDLISGTRHILWSLTNTQASVTEIATYVADRARAYCAEHDRALRISMPATWPAAVPDPEQRHLLWVVAKDALKELVNIKTETSIELAMAWRDGIVLTITMQGEFLPAHRKALAETMTAHHLRVSRAGGSLRTDPNGPLQMEVSLPMPVAESNGNRSMNAVFTGLLIFGLVFASPTIAQNGPLFRHAQLDSLFTSRAVHASPADRLRLINTTINALDRESDPRLECNLSLARAKEMYYQGLYEVGISDVNRSLTLAQTIQDSLLIATTYNMYGLLYENLGNDAVTLPWFELAGRWLPKDTRSNYPVVKDYHIDGNIAQCLLNMGRTDSAEYYFERSKSAARSAGNLRAQALANLGLARVGLTMHDPRTSEALLDSARSQALRDGSRDVQVDILPVLAEVRMQRLGRKGSARVLDEAIAFLRSDSTITPVSRRNFFKHESLLREELGQPREAMIAWREWQREDSIIHAQDDRASIATLKIMLDNDQRLIRERAERGRTQAQLAMDREQLRITISAVGVILLLLLGVLLLYIGRRRNLRRMTTLERERSEVRKELAELRVRQRLSDEMHQELGAGLDALKLRSTLALEVEPDPAGRERLAHIAERAGELIGSLRQVIWALDTGRSSVQETVQYTAHYARTYAVQQGLTIGLHVDDQWPDDQLTMEQRRNIFLVVKESLHNIVKHAHATEATLNMKWENGLHVEIKDNGRGFAPTAHNGSNGEGNGLRNMRKRIASIGGEFEVLNGSGSTIRFTVPLMDPTRNNGSNARTTA